VSEQSEDNQQPPPPSRWHKLFRRQLPLVVLVAGIGYLVVRLLQAQPVSVEVVYRYGAAGRGLAEVSMRYLRQGEELRRIRYRYDEAGPPAEQTHQIMVPEGEYTIALELRYSGEVPTDLRHRSVAEGGGQLVKILRPLIVAGQRRVVVHVGRDDG
jgi:hypothetical protein